MRFAHLGWRSELAGLELSSWVGGKRLSTYPLGRKTDRYPSEQAKRIICVVLEAIAPACGQTPWRCLKGSGDQQDSCAMRREEMAALLGRITLAATPEYDACC